MVCSELNHHQIAGILKHLKAIKLTLVHQIPSYNDSGVLACDMIGREAVLVEPKHCGLSQGVSN